MGHENFGRYCQLGMGGPFVALHLGYHHYATLLYFPSLENPSVLPAPATGTYYQRCKFHTSSYSDLLKLSRETDGCHVIYPTVGHMAVVSSLVLLHTLLLGEWEEVPDARDRMNSNFQAIIELSQYWTNTTHMVGPNLRRASIESTDEYIMTYEICDSGDPGCPVYYKIASSPLEFDCVKGSKIHANITGETPGNAPFVG